jgi:hypothetical protein
VEVILIGFDNYKKTLNRSVSLARYPVMMHFFVIQFFFHFQKRRIHVTKVKYGAESVVLLFNAIKELSLLLYIFNSIVVAIYLIPYIVSLNERNVSNMENYTILPSLLDYYPCPISISHYLFVLVLVFF